MGKQQSPHPAGLTVRCGSINPKELSKQASGQRGLQAPPRARKGGKGILRNPVGRGNDGPVPGGPAELGWGSGAG